MIHRIRWPGLPARRVLWHGRGIQHVVLEDPAFDAQQATEKAIKALLVARSIPFPKTHDISELLNRITSTGSLIPQSVSSAANLTPYAVRTRCPGGRG